MEWRHKDTTSKDITLSASDFNKTGGILYAQFETTGGVKYRSHNQSIKVGDDPVGGGGNTSEDVTIEDFKIKEMKYENWVPVANNIINVPPQSSSSVNITFEFKVVKGSNCNKTIIKLYRQNPGEKRVVHQAQIDVPDCLKQGETVTVNKKFWLDNHPGWENINHHQVFDGALIDADIIVHGKQKRYTSINKKYKIKILDTPKITGNRISVNQEVKKGTAPEKIGSGRDPYHHGGRNQPIIEGNFTFQWQKLVNDEWTNIQGATSKFYQPGPIYKITYFRRLGRSLGLVKASNEIRIMPYLDILNKICCSQERKVGESPAILTGHFGDFNGGVVVQWQQRFGRGSYYWEDIEGETKFKFTPPSRNIRGGSVYRRLLILTDQGAVAISNEVIVSFVSDSSDGGTSTSPPRRRRRSVSMEDENNLKDRYRLFPNPVTSAVSVETDFDLSNSQLQLLDITGNVVYKEKVDTVGKVASVNLERLPKGIYFMIIQTKDGKKYTEKLIKD
ncbi:T9SS type A sorting domain-containing protein [Sinomicrobium sp. M5D2P9]